MPISPLLFVLTSSIVVAGFAGLVVFLTSFRKGSIFANPFSRDWGLGLLLSSLIRIPTASAVAGMPLSSTIDGMAPYYAVGSVALIGAHALFFRGTVRFFTDSRFWINYFPLLSFLCVNAVVFYSLQVLHLGPGWIIVEVATVVSLNILFLVGANYKLICGECSHRERVGSWLFVIGWVMFLLAHTYMTFMLHRYPTDFWFFAITSFPTIFIYSGYTISYLLLLSGFILNCTYKRKST
ncbi:MAG: hypothetical protein AAB804_02350 [Patescibacteria group bacterium]